MQNEVTISKAQWSFENRMQTHNPKFRHLGRSRGAFHDNQHEHLYEKDFKDIYYDLSKIHAYTETKTSDLLPQQTRQKPSKKQESAYE